MTTQVIILAGGLGKRMGGIKPKVLIPFRGRPMISYLLDSVAQSGVSARPVIVVGKMAEMVQSELGPNYEYVFQKEPASQDPAFGCGHHGSGESA